MTILERVYASAPTDEIILPTLEIEVPGFPLIRLCSGFEDQLLGVDGVLQLFQAVDMAIALPAKGTNGQQSLSFGFANVTGQVQRYIDAAQESDDMVWVTYREYLLSDRLNPAKRPYRMTLTGGNIVEDIAQIEASFYDLLNTAWPRERYTEITAPGVKYL